MKFGWTLQTLNYGRVPWHYLNCSALFLPFNLTCKKQVMAMKDASYTMLHIEKLEQLPFTVAETHSAAWFIHGVIWLPILMFQFTACLKHFSVGRYEPFGSSYIHELWSLLFTYHCQRAEREVFLIGEEWDSTAGHFLVCQHVKIHCACNVSNPNLTCYFKGNLVPVIIPTLMVLSNGSSHSK